jgi:alkaline phosphatase D
MNKLLKSLFINANLFFCFHIGLSAPQCTFQYGVASGDATSNQVILWTHITTSTTDTIMVSCEVATDSLFTQVVFNQLYYTHQHKDFTVKIDAALPIPDKKYFYRFIYKQDTSAVGITYTLPLQLTTSYKIGFASCAHYEAGYFNAYNALSKINGLRAVVHLGDYIYEYASGEYAHNKKIHQRFEPLHELLTLQDYRQRYKQYRRDTLLQHLHHKVPFYCIWDDHEFADDAHQIGAENHTDATEGAWSTRSDAAKQAYFEWMPIRENEFGNIYRQLKIGNLVSLLFLDTRMDDRVKGGKMMSSTQQEWYYNALKSDEAIWKITVQQVMMAPLNLLGYALNNDQWDGFNNERDQLFRFVKDENIRNFVVLSGDFHSSWASELRYHQEVIGREIVCPGITAPGLNFTFLKHLISFTNPHVKFVDLVNNGFVTLDITHQYIKAQWHFLETVDAVSSQIKRVNTFYLPVNQLVFKQQVPIESAIVENDW